MWLRAARSRLLVRVVAALLVALVGGSTLEWGHGGGDDRDCGAVAVLHDHEAHRLSGAQASPSSSNDHCYICHSLRLLHAALVVSHERLTADASSTQFHAGAPGIARYACRLHLPSRAPPPVVL
jgi:hypothetical protein